MNEFEGAASAQLEQENDGKRTLRLTKSQCANVADFIDLHLIDTIRQDADIDNVGWIEDMIGAMRALEEAGKDD